MRFRVVSSLTSVTSSGSRRPARSKACEGFVQGRPGERIAALRDEVLDGLLAIAGLLEVHGQDAGHLAASFGIQRLQRLSHEPVQLTALLLQERPVGGVLDEPVSEEVLELRSVGSDLDEALGLERVEVGRHRGTPL